MPNSRGIELGFGTNIIHSMYLLGLSTLFYCFILSHSVPWEGHTVEQCLNFQPEKISVGFKKYLPGVVFFIFPTFQCLITSGLQF
ncbi:hypothetical protein I7I50_06869 [Histoplasma capsulatum G186AR]|uniref:Uncharacterized protein n=1 Tax=Ajellomyces capsulatus TaxID=5037 RepID=A0A8H7Z0N5_AJECA|nr:hypothetical protein I7I52_10058 [Histoplasma capsulatum]QSS67708.1 hypothetical protein I7I50_06869 [Histoplasma capsulatum G186AR]